MEKKEIQRRLYHLSFFEKSMPQSKNNFINSIVKKLYDEYKILKDLNLDELNFKINDLISVIMPAYNDENSIDYAIESILSQTYTNWELIIIDDGSTDNTKNIIDKYLKIDSRIKYFFQENTGVAGARNTGINKSTGSLIKLCDSDDILMPYALDILIRSLAFCDNKTALFYDDMVYKYNDTYEINVMNQPLVKNELYEQQLKGNIFPVGSVLIRKSVFDEIGYFDTNINGVDDFDMWNRIIQYYGVYKINIAPIYIQVMHDDQQSKDMQTIKCYTDKSINKLINGIGIDKIYEKIDSEKSMIQKYELLIDEMYKRVDTPYDSIIKLINYAQSLDYKQEREYLIIKLINENNDNFILSYTNFMKNNKEIIDNPEDLYNFFMECINKNFKLNKIYCINNKEIISSFHTYNKFCIEYKIDHQTYKIIYSNWNYDNLPIEIVQYLNNNFDQIWVDNSYIRQKHIDSGILEEKIKILNLDNILFKENNLEFLSRLKTLDLNTKDIKHEQILSRNKLNINKEKILNILNDLDKNYNLKDLYINNFKNCSENQYYRKYVLLTELCNYELKNNDYSLELIENMIKIRYFLKANEMLSNLVKKGIVSKKILLNMSICIKEMGDIKTSEILLKKSNMYHE